MKHLAEFCKKKGGVPHLSSVHRSQGNALLNAKKTQKLK